VIAQATHETHVCDVSALGIGSALCRYSMPPLGQDRAGRGTLQPNPYGLFALNLGAGEGAGATRRVRVIG